MHTVTYLEAINEALIEEMERNERVFVMGEDVSWNLMGVTKGLFERFGRERVRDTPISEAGFVGAGAGAAMVGMRPVVHMLIAPFVYVAFDQIVSIIAKSTYLYGGQAKMPITLMAPMLYGRGNAAQHSDRPYSTLMSIPGLKLIAPATPHDAKGMLKAAIRDDDPVISFEDGNLWTQRGDVPDDDYVVPLGVADVRREGDDVTVVALAGAVPHALSAAEELDAEGISAEVIDLRSIVPLDRDNRADVGRQDRPARCRRSRSRDGLGGLRGGRYRGPGGFLEPPSADHPGDDAPHSHPLQRRPRAAPVPERRSDRVRRPPADGMTVLSWGLRP